MSARLALRMSALAFGAFALWSLISVEAMLGLVGVTAITPAARVELRAFYGGLELGFAAYLWFASREPTWVKPALAAAFSIFAGCALVRLAAMGLIGDFDNYDLTSLVCGCAAACGLAYVYVTTSKTIPRRREFSCVWSKSASDNRRLTMTKKFN